jgi:hypothetical protein
MMLSHIVLEGRKKWTHRDQDCNDSLGISRSSLSLKGDMPVRRRVLLKQA